MHLDIQEVCEKYGMLDLRLIALVANYKLIDSVGSIARIGPNLLVTSDREIWRRIQAVRSPYRRSDWYIGMRFDPSRDNLESQRDDAKHTALRAKMAPGVSKDMWFCARKTNIFTSTLVKRMWTSSKR
jgi:hypothetical protein